MVYKFAMRSQKFFQALRFQIQDTPITLTKNYILFCRPVTISGFVFLEYDVFLVACYHRLEKPNASIFSVPLFLN
jgi:hypothetical protein